MSSIVRATASTQAAPDRRSGERSEVRRRCQTRRFAPQYAFGVEAADRQVEIARHVARELQHQIAAATDPQKGREVRDFPMRFEKLLMELHQQLRQIHRVALSNLLEHAPIEVFEANARRIAAHPHGFEARSPHLRIRADEEPAHRPPPGGAKAANRGASIATAAQGANRSLARRRPPSQAVTPPVARSRG